MAKKPRDIDDIVDCARPVSMMRGWGRGRSPPRLIPSALDNPDTRGLAGPVEPIQVGTD